MENAQPTSFEDLGIPRRGLAQSGVSKYRIYSDAKDFKVVEAATAIQALELSGLQTPYKIMREDPMSVPLIGRGEWNDNNEAAEAAEIVVAAEVTSAASVEAST